MSIEYYVTRLTATAFKIAKFEGGEQPSNVYFLSMFRAGQKGWSKASDPEFHCDCPNRRRGKHINDKHGVMVAQWLFAGEPEGYFNETYELIKTERMTDDNSDGWDEGNAGEDDDGPEEDEGDEEHD